MAENKRNEDNILCWTWKEEVKEIDGQIIITEKLHPIFDQDIPTWEELDEQLYNLTKRFEEIKKRKKE